MPMDAIPPGSASPNALAHETSPYLLQHAHNPVHWFPWGEEALEKARAEDKPIFLSIGYSACHWCHVMERESFENVEIARVLNERFVSIKIDREERPDLDDIYMTAVVSLAGQGGWPLTVFLTPDKKPFYGGTYYPPVDMFGRPGFMRVIHSISDSWANKRAEVLQSAEGLTDYVKAQMAGAEGEAGVLTPALIEGGVTHLKNTFDAEHGGWGGAPKFPSSPSIALLLRAYQRSGDKQLLHMATHTLTEMAYGGMYDQVGGGFHRYSVDAEWLVPHFEKMLYDNAQLSRVYLEAWQVTGDPLYRRVAEDIFGYVLRGMTGPHGAFYCAEDADSEGEEGKFYIWTYTGIIDALGPRDAAIYCRYYHIEEGGNFYSQESFHAGKNIPHVPERPALVAQALGMDTGALQEVIKACNEKLFAAREQRVRPGLDDKVLTSWNALMITALAQGAQVLDAPRYAEAAAKAAAFILREMRDGATLLRTHRHGESRLPAYLDDYAFFANACVDLYEATFDLEWIEAADDLAHEMINRFWDEEGGSFYFTEAAHHDVLVRAKPTFDGAEPSGNSIAALALLRLALLTGRPDYHAKATRILQVNAGNMAKVPHGFLQMLIAVDFALYSPKEIALVGVTTQPETQALLRAVRERFTPNRVVALLDPARDDAAALSKRVPLLEGRALVDGKPAAYVCRDFTCRLPVTTPEALLEQLRIE
jgi:uncharacterized protein YyaL (SSP411 family)